MHRLEDNSLMPFGKFKGSPMVDVPADYLDYIIDQPWIGEWPEVEEYIETNRKAINMELEESG